MSANPIFGFTGTRKARDGRQSTAVRSGDHCAAMAANAKAQLPNNGSIVHDRRVTE
jgi:hypothetical protein